MKGLLYYAAVIAYLGFLVVLGVVLAYILERRKWSRAAVRRYGARRQIELHRLNFEAARDAEQVRREIDRELR